MRSKFYISAYGNEKDISEFHKILGFPDSGIKPLRCKLPLDQSEFDQKTQWLWLSPYQECVGDFPEDEMEAYLQDNLSYIDKIKKCRGLVDSLFVTIVCQVEDGECLPGYSISPRIIKLLSDMDAALEIDVVPLL